MCQIVKRRELLSMEEVDQKRHKQRAVVIFFFLFYEEIDQRDRQSGLMRENDKHLHAEECRPTAYSYVSEKLVLQYKHGIFSSHLPLHMFSLTETDH